MLADGPASVATEAPEVTELALGELALPGPVQAASPTSAAVTMAASTARGDVLVAADRVRG
jgi:hypothetical protein